ncbi:hypothetical protein [Natrarchaeobaculum sulfurireducens]|uniref:Uncharacterized protein n=1 Tax=Natrarchaeobaculum sulfurireducens TaxID=2044521 RepID=A0A346P9M9_9EURY|nr:hypothetical protein [Natrarchaeobaculum sulfurireducens]AXR76224.1 hypothetical protein AArc1_5023 [Natrarchaeobaculum sulfurireducens]
MGIDDAGAVRSLALLGLVLAAVVVTATVGLALASDEPSGEKVLEDVQETYNTADSVVADATVTVETDEAETEFGLSTVVAGEEQMRTNVSTDEGHVVTGTDGEVVWLYESHSSLTGVVEENEGEKTASVRAGTEEPAGLSLSELPIDPERIDGDDELGDVLEEFEDLSDGVDSDELPENVTVAELLADAGVDGEDYDGVDHDEAWEDYDEIDLPEAWEDYDEADLSKAWEDSGVDGAANDSDLAAVFGAIEDGQLEDGDGWEDTWAALDDWNESMLEERIAALEDHQAEITHPERMVTGDINDSEVSVEHAGSATIDGKAADELLLTHPEAEGETRLWIGVDSGEVLKMVTTTADITVTVDVHETQFDVPVADSTFDPPGAVELASIGVSTAETAEEFSAVAPFATATPDEQWAFENGAVVSGEAPELIDEDRPDVVVAGYVDGDRSILIGQSEVGPDERTAATEWMETPESKPNGSEWVDKQQTIPVDDRELLVVATDDGVVGTFVEDGVSTTVAGDLSERELQEVVAGLEVDGS